MKEAHGVIGKHRASGTFDAMLLMHAVAILGLTVALLGNASCGPNSDGSKFREVERLQRTVPVFPGMVETQESRTSKGTVASIHKHYRSPEVYEDVKEFYAKQLTESGWSFVGERSVEDWGRDLGGRELKFERDGYYIVLFYSGQRSDADSKYGVSVGWRQ